MSRQKALADPHQMQTVHIEKLSDTQCQPESRLKFITEARLQDFRQNGDDAIVDIEVRTGGARIGDYEYRLSMPMGTLTIKSLKDLDELEKKLDDLDSKEAEEKRRRLSQANKRATSHGVTLAAKKPPRKNKKKVNNVESEADIVANSSMVVERVAVVAKPKGRGGSRKAPPKKDDEMQSLQGCLAAYNLGSSGDLSAAMETEQPQEPTRKKVSKRALLESKTVNP
ncbi:hypothetical protein L6164_017647 [Bauhinia variegata]|uniref:Uncharacterized protein n=1 Tax=Bauhinia variegata TaxID=167791 RepID=A0ACB9N981_BAUVA|nr:hypothetical protein L6164_017647 [Bauhinia variegata]